MAIPTKSPRVEACIEAVMLRYPSDKSTKYFEAVHQELAPLARTLEAENQALREDIAALRSGLATGAIHARPSGRKDNATASDS